MPTIKKKSSDILLHFEEGKTVEEVAELTPYSLSTIKSYWNSFNKSKPKHIDIYGLIELGYSNHSICKLVACSEQTVAKYRKELALLQEANPRETYKTQISEVVRKRIETHNIIPKAQRKIDIFACIQLGLSNLKISKLLECSPNTISKYKAELDSDKEAISYISQISAQAKKNLELAGLYPNVPIKQVSTGNNKIELFHQIYAYKSQGYKQIEISKLLNLPQSRVSILLKEYYKYKLKHLAEDKFLLEQVQKHYTEGMQIEEIAKKFALTSEIITSCLHLIFPEENTLIDASSQTNTQEISQAPEQLKEVITEDNLDSVSATEMPSELVPAESSVQDCQVVELPLLSPQPYVVPSKLRICSVEGEIAKYQRIGEFLQIRIEREGVLEQIQIPMSALTTFTEELAELQFILKKQ